MKIENVKKCIRMGITVFKLIMWEVNRLFYGHKLHCPSMFAVQAKIYGVLYNQASSIAFDETSSYWSASKTS